MRAIPEALQARLDSGATTLCRCWILRRRDGMVQGFTDHDDDLLLGDVLCRAGTGLSGSGATARLGLAVDGAEISGALSDEGLCEKDLAAGCYDAACVESYIVDWSEPTLHVLLARGRLGEVRREGEAFTAETRGLADELAQESGRLYTAACSADLGDARCGIDLSDAAFHAQGMVSALRGHSAFVATGLDAFSDGWFSAGRLSFTTGTNASASVEVKRHRLEAGEVIVELWQALPEVIAAADAFTVTAGCDKRFATCRSRFANSVNFRGFPHIPGNDFIVRYAIEGEPGNDGRSLQSD